MKRWIEWGGAKLRKRRVVLTADLFLTDLKYSSERVRIFLWCQCRDFYCIFSYNSEMIVALSLERLEANCRLCRIQMASPQFSSGNMQMSLKQFYTKVSAVSLWRYFTIDERDFPAAQSQLKLISAVSLLRLAHFTAVLKFLHWLQNPFLHSLAFSFTAFSPELQFSESVTYFH